MRYSFTITERDLERLVAAIFSQPGAEGAAYLLCGRSIGDDETRLLVREVVPVAEEHYLVRELDRLSISSRSYASIAKKARDRRDSIVFVHSHPSGFVGFSPQDDREEPALMQFFCTQSPEGLHGSLVVDSPSSMRGRAWTDGGWQVIERVRVVGTRFRFSDVAADQEPIPEFFDRQVRAFGPDIQRLLRRLHVGVVGAGGTGSAVIEQLTRLGVGMLSVFDGQTFEASNVNRVYGSTVADSDKSKVDIAARHVQRIGLGTTLLQFDKPINDHATAKHLRSCDVVFGCTDTHAARGILVRLALWYLIPVIDMAVKIDSEEGIIRGIFGRVTTLLPGEACLFCRERVTSEMIRLESLSPDERRALVDENYAPELEEDAPAVIMFTSAVAAQAITELLHRLAGFMGSERRSSEVLLFYHDSEIKRNRTPPKPECLCSKRENWGKGDRRDFLGLVWP